MTFQWHFSFDVEVDVQVLFVQKPVALHLMLVSLNLISRWHDADLCSPVCAIENCCCCDLLR